MPEDDGTFLTSPGSADGLSALLAVPKALETRKKKDRHGKALGRICNVGTKCLMR